MFGIVTGLGGVLGPYKAAKGVIQVFDSPEALDHGLPVGEGARATAPSAKLRQYYQ